MIGSGHTINWRRKLKKSPSLVLLVSYSGLPKELAEICGEEGVFIHKGLKAFFAIANKFEHTGYQLDAETPE